MFNRIENPFLRNLTEWIFVIALAFILALVTRAFLFRVTRVTGYSMVPTLNHGDVLILNRFTYLFNDPSVGDIVAFPFPEDPSDYFIKRIVAAPGDVVDFIDGVFYVNGTPLDDAFSHIDVRSMVTVNFPVTVEEGRYFVLGDNRNNSQDSRYSTVSNVYGRDMLGRVFVRVWPFSSFGGV